MKKIYFDHSATTPVDGQVLKAMLPYFTVDYGNASSIHNFGQSALAGIDKAREQVASFLHCEISEVIFTSGATESNNLAIKGLLAALKKQGRKQMHVITSVVEHDAVLEPCMELEQAGVAVTHLPVDSKGVVSAEAVKKAITEDTVLVSVMYVNSEVGAVMPIRAIAKIIRRINEKRMNDWLKRRPKERGDKPQPIYFHTDATQAVNFFNCDVNWNMVDILSMSGHKIYGPKGVGVLFRRQGVPIEPIMRGGHQEGNYRSGTYNVPGIVGMGQAVALLGKSGEKGELSNVQKKNRKIVSKLRDKLVAEITKNIPEAILNTDQEYGSPSHAHFTFPGAEGEAILIGLDLKGIAVSTGSACASGSLKASHVLLAMGIKKEIAHNSIRFTLGKNNTEEEIKKAVKELAVIIQKLRDMNPLYKK